MLQRAKRVGSMEIHTLVYPYLALFRMYPLCRGHHCHADRSTNLVALSAWMITVHDVSFTGTTLPWVFSGLHAAALATSEHFLIRTRVRYDVCGSLTDVYARQSYFTCTLRTSGMQIRRKTDNSHRLKSYSGTTRPSPHAVIQPSPILTNAECRRGSSRSSTGLPRRCG